MAFLSKPVLHYYGEGKSFSTDCNKTQCNNNVLVIGGSGSGKTVSVMEMEFLQNVQRKASMIVHVSKKKLIHRYSDYFRGHGFDVEILDFADPENSTVAFDPLMFLQSPDDYTNAMELAKNIVETEQSRKSDQDPYWNQAAESLLVAEIMMCLGKNYNATISDVLDFHSSLLLTESGMYDELETIADEDYCAVQRRDPSSPLYSYWATFRQNANNTARCIYSCLTTPFKAMCSPEFCANVSMNPPVDIEKIVNRPTILFVYTSPVKTGSHAIANLFANYAIHQMYELAEKTPEDCLPREVNYVFDDFACGAIIQDFAKYIAIFREKGISTTILIQDMAQLENLYGSSRATTIMNNCDTQIFMGGMDPKTIATMARRMNVPENDLGFLTIGQEYLLRRGEPRAYRLERYQITNTPEYQEIYRKEHVTDNGGEKHGHDTQRVFDRTRE